jgi:hypothetical protein
MPKEEDACELCVSFHQKMAGGMGDCRRYPQSVLVSPQYCCREFRSLKLKEKKARNVVSHLQS